MLYGCGAGFSPCQAHDQNRHEKVRGLLNGVRQDSGKSVADFSNVAFYTVDVPGLGHKQ
jgi:hypothetical protein